MSPTILDALEEDLEASAVSTVPASSWALRFFRLVSEPTSHESMGPDAAIPVMNIVNPDSEVLSDTATDPDLVGEGVDNVEEGAEESEVSSSGVDSIVDNREAHHAVGGRAGVGPSLGRADRRPCDSSRVRQSGSCGSGQFIQVKSHRDEVSFEVLASCILFGNPGGVDKS